MILTPFLIINIKNTPVKFEYLTGIYYKFLRCIYIFSYKCIDQFTIFIKSKICINICNKRIMIPTKINKHGFITKNLSIWKFHTITNILFTCNVCFSILVIHIYIQSTITGLFYLPTFII